MARHLRTPSAPIMRHRSLDGLRGLALVLVVLSHGWALWPIDAVEEGTPWGQMLRSGNLGVTVFLVVGGYLLIDGFTRLALDGPRGEYGRAALRRVVRIAVPVMVLILTVLAVAVLDPTDKSSPDATRKSAWAIATFTWNWYLQSNAMEARPDLGHLWYVSIFVQTTILLTLLHFILRRHRWAFVLVVAGALGLVIWWRAHLADQGGDPIIMLLRTTTRIDGMLWGALLAATSPWWRGWKWPWRLLASIGLLSLLALTLTVGNSVSYFGWQGQAMAIATVLAVAGLVAASQGWTAARALSVSPLAWLGENSLTIYVWHYPVFFFVARHTGGWSWPARTLAGLALAGVISYVLIHVVERPLSSQLRSWRWTRPRSATPKAVLEGVDTT